MSGCNPPLPVHFGKLSVSHVRWMCGIGIYTDVCVQCQSIVFRVAIWDTVGPLSTDLCQSQVASPPTQ